MALSNNTSTSIFFWAGVAYVGVIAARRVFDRYKQPSENENEDSFDNNEKNKEEEKYNPKAAILQNSFFQWVFSPILQTSSSREKKDEDDNDVKDNDNHKMDYDYESEKTSEGYHVEKEDVEQNKEESIAEHPSPSVEFSANDSTSLQNSEGIENIFEEITAKKIVEIADDDIAKDCYSLTGKAQKEKNSSLALDNIEHEKSQVEIFRDVNKSQALSDKFQLKAEDGGLTELLGGYVSNESEEYDVIDETEVITKASAENINQIERKDEHENKGGSVSSENNLPVKQSSNSASDDIILNDFKEERQIISELSMTEEKSNQKRSLISSETNTIQPEVSLQEHVSAEIIEDKQQTNSELQPRKQETSSQILEDTANYNISTCKEEETLNNGIVENKLSFNETKNDENQERTSTSSAFSVLDVDESLNKDVLQSTDIITSCDTSLKTLQEDPESLVHVTLNNENVLLQESKQEEGISDVFEDKNIEILDAVPINKSSKGDIERKTSEDLIISQVVETPSSSQETSLKNENEDKPKISLQEIFKNVLDETSVVENSVTEVDSARMVSTKERELANKAHQAIKETVKEICYVVDNLSKEGKEHTKPILENVKEEKDQPEKFSGKEKQILHEITEFSKQTEQYHQKFDQHIAANVSFSEEANIKREEPKKEQKVQQPNLSYSSIAKEEKLTTVTPESKESTETKEFPLNFNGSIFHQLTSQCDMSVQMKLLQVDNNANDKNSVVEEMDIGNFKLYLKTLRNLNLKTKSKVQLKIELVSKDGSRRKKKTDLMKPSTFLIFNKLLEFEKVPKKLMSGHLVLAMWTSSAIGSSKRVLKIDVDLNEKIQIGRTEKLSLKEFLLRKKGSWIDINFQFK